MIMWFTDFLLGGPKPKEWKYIGHSDIGLTETDKITNKKTDFVVKLLYFMTDGGERKIELQTAHPGAEKWITQYNQDYAEALVWTKGGSFPEHFKAENDVLGDMLSRLIDQKITGEK